MVASAAFYRREVAFGHLCQLDVLQVVRPVKHQANIQSLTHSMRVERLDAGLNRSDVVDLYEIAGVLFHFRNPNVLV